MAHKDAIDNDIMSDPLTWAAISIACTMIGYGGELILWLVR